MTRNKQVRFIFALILAAAMMLPATVAFAQEDDASDEPAAAAEASDSQGQYGPQRPDGPQRPERPEKPPMGKEGPVNPMYAGATGPATPPPIAITGPRMKPPAIPHSDVFDPAIIVQPLPAQSLEADAADGGKTQEKPGRGVKQTATGLGAGLTLYASPNVCNDFNPLDGYAVTNGKSDIWTDWYAGWAPFAVDNGYYQAKNLTFSMERVVGPGNNYNDDEDDDDEEQASVKIGSNQPYAGGFGSPIIPVPEDYRGGKVMVTVKYLIWDHDTGGSFGGDDGSDYDWASMGVKAGAHGDYATYVNGYIRGEWAELTNTIDLGNAPDVMVLLQGQSPGAFNSNIYFDDVKIAFIDKDGNGAYLKDCTSAEALE
jgi:hypothetical protein